MLINLSNHPYELWGEEQKAAAIVYGECIDMPFPSIPPEYDDKQVTQLAEDYFEKIKSFGSDLTVHIMGEQTFCYALISKLLNNGIECLAACSVRDVTILPDGSKQVRFHFSRFRNYPKIY